MPTKLPAGKRLGLTADPVQVSAVGSVTIYFLLIQKSILPQMFHCLAITCFNRVFNVNAYSVNASEGRAYNWRLRR